MKKADYSDINCERGKRLLSLRKFLRFTRANVAEQSTISARNLQNWESGRTTMSEANLATVVEFYQQQGIKCTPEWVLYGVGVSPLDLLKNQQQGIKSGTDTTNDKLFIQQELMLFHQHYPNAIDTIIADNSMQPYFYPQDIVAGIQLFGDDVRQMIGEVCIVKTVDKGLLVRKMEKGTNGHTFDLYRMYPKLELAEQVDAVFCVAGVVWVRRCVDCKNK